MVELIARRPMRAGEIADSLSLTPQAASRHLRVLRRGGLIQEKGIEEDARVRVYHLRQAPLRELRDWLDEVESFWVGELSSFRDHVARRKKGSR
jgi:DNA-binding transcriptional ArsR family regulator